MILPFPLYRFPPPSFHLQYSPQDVCTVSQMQDLYPYICHDPLFTAENPPHQRGSRYVVSKKQPPQVADSESELEASVLQYYNQTSILHEEMPQTLSVHM